MASEKNKLSNRGKRRTGFVVIALMLLFISLYYFVFSGLPSLENPPFTMQSPSIQIVDRNGFLLYEIIPEEGGRHQPLLADQMPLCLKQATIATEDKNFYTNPGIDLNGVLRAAWTNLKEGEISAGGSTITQQVARNLLLSEDERFQQTYRRKLREAALAWQLTNQLEKEEILALYLNQMNYGNMAYGIEAAAQTYFGKPSAELDLAECALIAGLPQAPGYYNPYANYEGAKERQLIVLMRMEAEGYITALEQSEAGVEYLVLNPDPYPVNAPHFVWAVQAQVEQLRAGGILTSDQSLKVWTTLDLALQERAEAAIHDQLKFLADQEMDHNVSNAALVSINPQTGEVLAYVGSADYFDLEIFGALDMVSLVRQPGSAFKPIIYATGMQPILGSPVTASTVWLDTTTHFSTADGKPYTPENYDRQGHGPVTTREALASSLNIPAVSVLDQIGIAPVVDLAKSMGLVSLGEASDYDLSMALGGGQVSLFELTAAYGVFAAEGKYVEPRIILRVTDETGSLIYSPDEPETVQALDARIAWLISDILSDDDARAIGFGHNSILRLDRPAAVKTGTTSNFHDNWTIGYVPQLVVGVWVGNSDYQAMNLVTGITGAGPIWHQFMRTALNNQPETWYGQPEEMEALEVCKLSGLLPTDLCKNTYFEWFLSGTVPVEEDNFYREILIDVRTDLAADSTTPEEYTRPKLVFDFPVGLLPWARENGYPLLVDYIDISEMGREQGQYSLVILNPRPNAIYVLDAELHPAVQKIQLEAAVSSSVTAVTFWIDGEIINTLVDPPYSILWELLAGHHQFWVTASLPNGEEVRSDVIEFDVYPPG